MINTKTHAVGHSASGLMMAFAATLIAIQPLAHACSRVLWAAPDGQVFVGRTQDWTEKANSAFRVYPRGIERTGAVAENPHKWTTKYGNLILSAYDMGTHEGVNEKGLSAHPLYLAGESDFGKRDPRRPGIGVMQWVQYDLDNYATVAEAVEAQKTVAFQIEPLVLPNGFPTLVHVSLSDKSGDSAVIEHIGGKARIYHDRRFTVMTNEPTYDKQIENLKQYRTSGGDKPLPGERTPSDRFVRAAYMFSVIRNVSVPFGLSDPDKPNIASTIFRTVIDLTGGRYYFESTYAPNVVWIDFSMLDFSKGSGERELQVEKNIFSLNGDVTNLLEPAKPFVFGINRRGRLWPGLAGDYTATRRRRHPCQLKGCTSPVLVSCQFRSRGEGERDRPRPFATRISHSIIEGPSHPLICKALTTDSQTFASSLPSTCQAAALVRVSGRFGES